MIPRTTRSQRWAIRARQYLKFVSSVPSFKRQAVVRAGQMSFTGFAYLWLALMVADLGLMLVRGPVSGLGMIFDAVAGILGFLFFGYFGRHVHTQIQLRNPFLR